MADKICLSNNFNFQKGYDKTILYTNINRNFITTKQSTIKHKKLIKTKRGAVAPL